MTASRAFRQRKAFCSSMISVIDYGMGNLASVQKALAHLGFQSRLVSDAQSVLAAERLILPGVGAFGAAMRNLERYQLIEPIRKYCRSGRPFLGICLGMQLIMSESNELGHWEGLDIIPGSVVRFFEDSPVPVDIKIPHMGWNSLDIQQDTPILEGIPSGASFYFVHSYYVVPRDAGVIAASCTHGESFAAVLSSGNIHATQFHPEKSGGVGLQILHSFAAAAL